MNTKKTIVPWRFKKRWRIEGCLLTRTPLHIGSGDVISHPDIVRGDEKVDINSQTMDHAGLPCIFGSTLKGCIRCWMEEHFRDGFTLGGGIDVIMGKGAPDAPEQALGGIAEFHDARLSVRRTEPTPLPYWNPKRQTWIEACNSIDRHTGTAADEHLIYTECVPAGVGFNMVITGSFDDEDQVTRLQEQVAFLLAALEGFNDEESPILVGADTASGKGRMEWTLVKILRMDAESVLDWLKSPERGMAASAMKMLDREEESALRAKASATYSKFTAASKPLNIPITLCFDSHFLVNDPPTKREIDAVGKSDEKIPSHRARLDEMGIPLLPAKSFRGAFRSQAERILRTLNPEYACDPSKPKENHTCAKSITSVKGKENLCLACQIFGAPGWKSPLQIDDFLMDAGTEKWQLQEFVAIDRFTSGGKDGAKFSACSVYKPELRGCLKIDERRVGPTGLAVLALTLRDLKEGDIAFGFGAAKGYGTCRADIPIFEEESFKKKVRISLEELRKFHVEER